MASDPGQRLRVGIDVGGTFTDVVAIDAATRALVARVKVPTTHEARSGVAEGIVAGIERLLDRTGVDAGSVAFIAHSTTQATNALLEGDLASVGILGLLDGFSWPARRQMRFAPMALASGVTFAPAFEFANAQDDAAVRAGIDRLVDRGTQALAATRSFGVDRPDRESDAVDYARERGIEATSGHDVSSAYGLRSRTRTAALNAAILPKMLRTARMTAGAVERAAIPAPLMVMRSDGGVMDIREIERRPILTLLSGPAAGIAGALLYERLSDGIFVEVGGTSSDCSAIVQGRPQMQPATIGGHRTMLRTLDVRTLGIGGGSMLRVNEASLSDVGPRSAHIAGCRYASFVEPELLEGARVELVAPTPQDRADYVVLVARDGTRIAPTLTCAANAAGSIPAGAFARGNERSARRAFELLAESLGGDALSLAKRAIDLGVAKLRAALAALISDYALDPQRLVIVGGGGGCGALVPALAEAMQLPHRIARDAEVIAPIGVALALVRDVVERTIPSPTPEEIASIRREAADRVIAAGAAPDRVVVEVEIDSQRSRVCATASGATALVEAAAGAGCTADERRAIAAQSLACEPSALEPVPLTRELSGYLHIERKRRRLRAIDEHGVIRVAVTDYELTTTTVSGLASHLRDVVEGATQFGDVGRALPALYLLRHSRVAVFDGLTSVEQAVALGAEEMQGCTGGEPIAVLVEPRNA
ncbi:MAG TPA: hydantoinase/oxoprolinase family protein [Candidatus Cybelea sp.]|jgi:N-methylhydantoinase A/oxoprolinase/acetone carboxylase beta subunit|nr:hydantoinase/oxoprolinase family protein [Candidatus Cybelea sp.]